MVSVGKIKVLSLFDKDVDFMSKDVDISDSQLDDLASRAKLVVSDDYRGDFKNSLSLIIELFDEMSKVRVCEFKSFDSHVVAYNNLRNDESLPSPSKSKIGDSCQHYSSDSGYFEVPKVLEGDG